MRNRTPLDDLEAEAHAFGEKMEKAKRLPGAVEAAGIARKASRRIDPDRCDVCESNITNLMHDMVDGLHRMSRGLRDNSHMLNIEEQKLEVAATRYLIDGDKSAGGEVREALEGWLRARRRARGEL